MKIAITGGTGFIGQHLAAHLQAHECELVLLSRRGEPLPQAIPGGHSVRLVSADLSDVAVLADAFAGCHAVAHCAGINRELGPQTYKRIHVEGTSNVVAACSAARVPKIVFMSFLRARPDCGSAYHESKWQAEEIVRNSGLDYTILKSGMVYGRGDHMLDHLSHSFFTFPFLPTVGLREKAIRPVTIDDLTEVMAAAIQDGRLSRKTLAVTGAEELLLSEAALRVANVVGRKIVVFPIPVALHYIFAYFFELTMKVPLAARAQVRILSEGVVDAAPPCDALPPDLLPARSFTAEQIRKGLPDPGRFRLKDLRCCA